MLKREIELGQFAFQFLQLLRHSGAAFFQIQVELGNFFLKNGESGLDLLFLLLVFLKCLGIGLNVCRQFAQHGYGIAAGVQLLGGITQVMLHRQGLSTQIHADQGAKNAASLDFQFLNARLALTELAMQGLLQQFGLGTDFAQLGGHFLAFQAQRFRG